MKVLLKTQLLAISFALFWLIYLNILAFLDQPDRALQYINQFVYGFAFLFAIIYFLLSKKLIIRNWLALPLVLIPYLYLYQPAAEKIQSFVINETYRKQIHFLAQSTGTMHLLAVIFGLSLAIMFTRPQLKK